MSTVRCPQCNLVHFATDIQCKRCGAGFFTTESESTSYVPETQQFQSGPTDSYANTFESQVQYQQRFDPRYQPDFEPQQQYGGYSQSPGRPAPKPKTKSGLAIFSLVAGIFAMPPISTFGAAFVGGLLAVGFGLKGFIFGVVVFLALIPIALITGIVAMRRARKSPQLFGGRGCAIGGVVCSSVVLVIIPAIAAIAVPNLLAARRAANEGNAIMSMRKIASAEEVATQRYPSSLCSDLGALAGMGFIDTELQKGEKSGYKFEVVKIPPAAAKYMEHRFRQPWATVHSSIQARTAFYALQLKTGVKAIRTTLR